MTETVLALVVTYNRLNYLKRCLEFLENQDRKINQILVINNDSNDGTQQFLEEKKSINVINQENLGSAGGWYTGIEYAINNNFDYIWMMDDDGYPDKNSLKNLLNSFTDSHACISSVVLNENFNNLLVFPIPKLNKYDNPVIFSLLRKYNKLSILKKNLIDFYNYANLFNGSLISLKSIRKIGNINKNYILYGDEVDYFYRLRKIGKVVTCLNSYHYHPDVTKRIINRTSAYYYLRNSIILNFKYFDKPILRSLLNVIILIFRLFYRNGFLQTLFILFSLKNNVFITSIYHAFIKRLGKFE